MTIHTSIGMDWIKSAYAESHVVVTSGEFGRVDSGYL